MHRAASRRTQLRETQRHDRAGLGERPPPISSCESAPSLPAEVNVRYNVFPELTEPAFQPATGRVALRRPATARKMRQSNTGTVTVEVLLAHWHSGLRPPFTGSTGVRAFSFDSDSQTQIRLGSTVTQVSIRPLSSRRCARWKKKPYKSVFIPRAIIHALLDH